MKQYNEPKIARLFWVKAKYILMTYQVTSAVYIKHHDLVIHTATHHYCIVMRPRQVHDVITMAT